MKFFCPICNEDTMEIFISKHKKNIYECKNENCGHFFTPPLKENQGIVPRNQDSCLHRNFFTIEIFRNSAVE